MNNLYIGENNIRDLNIVNTKAISYENSLSKTKPYYFIMEVNIDLSNTDTGDYTVTLVNSSFDTYTDWGDGTKNKEQSHTYTTSGNYTIISESYIKDLNIMTKFIIKKNNNCGFMFRNCNITQIPDGFSIPDDTKTCQSMFYGNQLTSLPEGFVLPDSVTNCSYMFYKNKLTSLPRGFTIPNNVIYCNDMFSYNQLTSLPEGFTIPNSVTNCSTMFSYNQLTSLPEGFTIPDSVTNCQGMFSYNQLTSLPEGFTIPDSVTNCPNMFCNNENLTGSITIKNSQSTNENIIYHMILNTQISEIRVPTAFPLTDDEIKESCGKSDVTVTRF